MAAEDDRDLEAELFGEADEQEDPVEQVVDYEQQELQAELEGLEDDLGGAEEEAGPSDRTAERPQWAGSVKRAASDAGLHSTAGELDAQEGALEQLAPIAEEAEEEDDEIDRLLSAGKRRKKGGAVDEMRAKTVVDTLISKMEWAAEEDIKALEAGQPATRKLSMLREVEEGIASKTLQEELLSRGVLGVLKAWLEPQWDGRKLALPNEQIRKAVLEAVLKLPIDTGREDHKSILKASQLGKVVMFLSRLDDEKPELRRLASRLVQTWCNPIFAAARQDDASEATRHRKEVEDQERFQRMLERKRMEKQMEAVEEKRLKDEAANKRMGESGFRYHARLPQPAKLDYMKQPESRVPRELVNEKSKSKNARNQKLVQKMRDAGKKSGGRSLKVSVEGRSLGMQ